MALSININVNNSDISIKNSKTGAKKNIKSISAGNLNDMTDREFNISQKRKVARKQAMKLISDAWDKDNKAAQGIKDMESEKADIANINADLKSKLKDIDKSQKDLQELYGVHSESQEQKDLELLKKYQDNRNGVSNDKFSKEEIDRLKELQNEPLTEYQKKALMINSSKDAIRSQIDQNDLKAMNKTMSINNAKLEQLKSQDMLKAGDAADSIIEAADKDIFGMLVNEGKQNIDDNMKEQQEEAKKAEEDKTEVYWIHFTGSNVKNILHQYGFPDKERVFQVGTSNEYEQIFKRIIIELQRCQDNYEEMLVLLLRHLLISFHRELTREHILKNEYLDHEMDNAVTFFSENYNQNINIDDYAASRGMSVSWFIRNFKKYTGSTPMQFIVGIRINNAQMLLETTTYSINEISKIIGYDNQLYFSRLFHKLKGYSPREYRKLRNKF